MSDDPTTPLIPAPEPDPALGELFDLGFNSAPKSASRNWQPPTVEKLQQALPQYEINAFLARGGMGAVYKGTQKSLRRTVAIKVLPPEIDDGDLHYTERFKHEAQAMARLSHPGIVAVFDAGETLNGLLYFVMEFIEGTDVAQLISSGGKLELQHALGITTAICDALAFAHEEGIIHRDIKPSNIMLDKKGRVKVADFGLAKTLDIGNLPITGNHVAMGTPDFIAPETLIPGIHVDQRADLYAVGVMLYQMLTGRIPRGRFALPSGLVPRMDKRLDAIVDKAMQTDREQRYSSASEITADIRRVNGVEPSSGGITKSRWMVAVAGVAALLLLGGVIWRMAKPLERDLGSGTTAQPSAGHPASSPQLAWPPLEKDAPQPVVNSLGMKFVPVPGTDVLFCIHPTRKKDYAAYATETPGLNDHWKVWQRDDVPISPDDDCPVAAVDWEDAHGFCAWLSKKEGRMYRLPTDREWSIAVGIGPLEKITQDTVPESLNGKIESVFAWGTAWPPPKGAGNFADASFKEKFRVQDSIPGYDDGYPTTSPVKSFMPNKIGLYDMAGNVWEWCEDWYNAEKVDRVLRGGGYDTMRHGALRASYRAHHLSNDANNVDGFRCVLERKNEKATASPQLAWPPLEKDAPPPCTNSLGMKFVSVPGTRVMFCIHETRNADYAAYAAENPGIDGTWLHPERDGFTLHTGPDLPVTMVNWDDANAFCRWLSRKEGRSYRLPTDHEWSCAVGIGSQEDEQASPVAHANSDALRGLYPWGREWPPPPGAGNFYDSTAEEELHMNKVIPGYTDDYATTAPVMSFKPNALGIYDLAGNVFEWCADFFNSQKLLRVTRSSAWETGIPSRAVADLRAARRQQEDPNLRTGSFGFRCVLERVNEPSGTRATSTPGTGKQAP